MGFLAIGADGVSLLTMAHGASNVAFNRIRLRTIWRARLLR